MKHRQYNVGIYCRLSKDDICTGDSSSIQSQKAILEKYVKENNWTIIDYYIDDGYSGTNFDRPDFQRMLDDIESEKINMVLVKDLSRLGRNYLMTGQYTDIYFPDRGIRFIALNDGIDTRNTDNDITPFKNILNEMYSRDISKKVRSAVRAKKQNGEFLSNYAPYGYMKDPENRNKLVIEEIGAAVVKKMFELGKSGMGSKSIAKMLTNNGILTPINHRAKLYDTNTGKPHNRWNAQTVNNILKSRYYIGDMVQGIYECPSFKRGPNKRKPTEEWYITPNTHEPIVDNKTWKRVQLFISSRKRVTKSNEIQLFAGFVKCSDCGYALSYSYSQGIPQYSCGQYRRHGKKACSCHYIRKDKLEEAVLEDIKQYTRFANEDQSVFLKRLNVLDNSHVEEVILKLNTEQKTIQVRLLEIDKVIKCLYEDSVAERISSCRFQKLLVEYETEQEELRERVQIIRSEVVNIHKRKQDSTAWLTLVLGYTGKEKLDRIILSDLINKINVAETRIRDEKKLTDVYIHYRFEGVVHHIVIGKEK
ncbi:MAG: recombinase family protein [Clostridiales bacterium]|nr:recombinase family protein [Clostridiales bacterium]